MLELMKKHNNIHTIHLCGIEFCTHKKIVTPRKQNVPENSAKYHRSQRHVTFATINNDFTKMFAR